MNEPITSIFQFLEQFEPQVTGHSHEPLDPGLRAKVQAFARGELSAGEQESFIQQLQSDPQLLGAMSDTVKSLRSSAGSPDKDRAR